MELKLNDNYLKNILGETTENVDYNIKKMNNPITTQNTSLEFSESLYFL
jgi:hypothetical protein